MSITHFSIFAKRPLLMVTAAFISGILAAELSASLLLICSSVILLLSLLLSLPAGRSGNFYLLLFMLISYTLGSLEYLYFDHLNMSRFKSFAEEFVEIDGFIASVPNIKENSVSYVISVKRLQSASHSAEEEGKVLLTTPRQEGMRLYDYGKAINIRGNIEAPMGRRNPGGFDYRKHLAKNGISAVIFARYYSIKEGENYSSNHLAALGLKIRSRIVKVINASLPGAQAGLLNGMLIGYREGLGEDVQAAFSDAGLTHIMAVSGANVAFIVFPLLFVLKKTGIGPRIRNACAIGVVILFAYITGLEPSVTRAVIMAVIVLTGQILRRDADIYTSISAAALLMLLFNPHTLFNIGFQLSFTATLSLVLFSRNISNILRLNFLPGFLRDTISATLAAQAGVLPISVLYFNKISLVSLLSNIIVVPVLEVITVLGSVMAVIGQLSLEISRLIGFANCTLLSLVLLTAKISAALPYASVKVPTPGFFAISLYYAAVFLFLCYRPQKGNHIRTAYLTGVILIAAAAVCLNFYLPGRLEVYFLDVGQGDSAFIRTPGRKTVLIDGGGSGANIGESTIIPFLLDMGVGSLDLVVATHAHDDHILGLKPVLEEFDTKLLAIPDYPGNTADLKSLLETGKQKEVQVLSRGDRIVLDSNTYFSVLSPQKNLDNSEISLNNTSVVLKLHYKALKILFTGDMEKAVEEQLLAGGEDLSSDVLKVGHHGSDTSTSNEFLKNVNPATAVISVGRNNFGHPSGIVLESLDSSGAEVFRTDECGAVLIASDGKRIKVRKTVNETN